MNKQLIKFGLVGLLNTGVDVLVFTLLTKAGCPLFLAQYLSYGCGMLNSFMLNRSWTFQSAGNKLNEAIRFLLLNLSVMTFVAWLIGELHGSLTLSLFVSKLAATIAGMIINYAGSRYFVFSGARSVANDNSENT